MRICYLGAGSWGFCLATLLTSKGHEVTSWTKKREFALQLNKHLEHPLYPGYSFSKKLRFTADLSEALNKAEMIVESVTSAGMRLVFEEVKNAFPKCPIVVTSKGIEQNTGLILPDVVIEILGKESKHLVGFLSGPSFAHDVIKGLPTSVVSTAYNKEVMMLICETFTTSTFRVYPNSDIRGVAFGGALKNIIAIACGISDGLELGYSSKASLMTRGLHEVRKLAVAEGCRQETIYGLSGMGDVCLTCGSALSRNYRFGLLLAKGVSVEKAKEEIGMVVEGAYTAISALQLSKKWNIPMPLTEVVYRIIYEGLKPRDAIPLLMQRTIKEEHL